MAKPEHTAVEHRVRLATLFDEEIRPHNELFRAATGARPGDRVLDVGCGTGRSTREAARAASGGSVLGRGHLRAGTRPGSTAQRGRTSGQRPLPAGRRGRARLPAR